MQKQKKVLSTRYWIEIKKVIIGGEENVDEKTRMEKEIGRGVEMPNERRGKMERKNRQGVPK